MRPLTGICHLLFAVANNDQVDCIGKKRHQNAIDLLFFYEPKEVIVSTTFVPERVHARKGTGTGVWGRGSASVCFSSVGLALLRFLNTFTCMLVWVFRRSPFAGVVKTESVQGASTC